MTVRDKSYGDCADSVEVSFLSFSQTLRGDKPTQALQFLMTVNCETKETCFRSGALEISDKSRAVITLMPRSLSSIFDVHPASIFLFCAAPTAF